MAAAGLTPERWQQVKQILQTVLEQPIEARPQHLDQACGTDAELRREVESLMVAEERAAGFLEPSLAPPPADFIPGQRLGPYDIVQKIGEGGMGVVYQALREDIRKLVAIKVVKQGLQSGFMPNRFLTERQILAHLDHPYVTKLLDSGLTGEGRPYFVMEFVAGQEIDAYCDRHRLNTSARLELFLKVCAGVDYAHRLLVVHRDIKPRNILVTEEGDPKLLDFGIAKILEEAPGDSPADATVTMVRMMTPEYASPEQARGLPVSTATDVYSLGVLLYELLTGQRPYSLKGRSPHEAADTICHQEAVRPSIVVRRAEQAVGASRDGSLARLERALAGDVDRIVLKALEKEPARRYASVERLADDIRRHLDGLPVLARKHTPWYYSSKFARRHKAGVAGAALLALSLVAGVAATLREAHLANLQRARAERRFQDVRNLANSLLFELHDNIRDLPGSTPARELLVNRALQYLDSLSAESAGDTGLRRELAAAYEKVGDVQGGYHMANLGNIAGALDSYRKALAIRDDMVRQGYADDDLRRDLVRNHGKLSDVLLNSGHAGEALDHSRKLLAMAQLLAGQNPGNALDQGRLAAAYLDVGWKQAGAGDSQNGIDNLRKATALCERLAAAHPDDAAAERRLAIAYDRTGSVIAGYTTGYAEALSLHRKYLAVATARAAAEPINTDLQRIAAYAHIDIGTDLLAAGEPGSARRYFATARTTYEGLSKADPKNVQYRLDVAYAEGLDAVAAIETGHAADAVRTLGKTLALLDDLPPSLDRTKYSATDELRLGRAWSRLAADPRLAPAARATLTAKAHGCYERSLPGLQEARQRGALLGRDSELVDEARQGIARTAH